MLSAHNRAPVGALSQIQHFLTQKGHLLKNAAQFLLSPAWLGFGIL
jgi:hypothetical protein